MEETLRKIGFDKTEINFFLNSYNGLDEADRALFTKLGEEFSFCQNRAESITLQEKLKPMATKYDMDSRSLDMLFLLSNLEKLREAYLKKGISEEIFYDTAKDFKYKLDECKEKVGVLGVIPFWWYAIFFRAEIVALGRFQYHTKPFFEGLTYEWGDFKINSDDEVVNFHIPSSGPMPREARIDSYKKAFAYFGRKKGEYLPIICESWLIFPGYREVFPKGSNLADFMEDFDIIDQSFGKAGEFLNARAVFGKPYDGDTSKLSANTTLQKNFIKFLNDGKIAGWGKGVILFDGEKIVNNKLDN